MYTIEADGVMFYSDKIPLDTYSLIDPNLIMEDCSAGSLEFTMPTTNVLYKKIFPLKTKIVVKRDGKEIWEGRPITEDTDFYNQIKIYCEGELAYLNDTTQPANEYHDITIRDFLVKVINIHNSKVLSDKKFNIGSVTVENNMTMTLRYTQYEKTMEVINTLIDDLGGHLRVRKDSYGNRYIDYLQEPIDSSYQTIKFGVNMTDFIKTRDLSTLATVILPLGEQTSSGSQSSVGDVMNLEDKDIYGYIDYAKTPYRIIEFIEEEYEGNKYTVAQITEMDGNEDFSNYYVAEIWVTPGQTYYYSGQMNGTWGMWCMLGDRDVYGDRIFLSNGYKKGGGEYINYEEEQKIEIPNEVTRLLIGGFEGSIPLRLNRSGAVHDVIDTYLTVESVNDGSMYVKNEKLVNEYGWIEKQITWDDVSDAQKLKELAESFLEQQIEDVTLEVTALDMKIMGADVDALMILQRIQAISKVHDLYPSTVDKDKTEETWFTISKLETPLNNPEDMTVTLGSNPTKNLTSVNNGINSDIYNKVQNLPGQTLKAAKDNAAALIGSAVGGYVTLVQNDNGTATQAITISEGEDYLTSQNMWIWNKNGLAYSTEGYSPSGSGIKTALTSDGQIVADMITTGAMRAERVHGGVLTVGGMDDINGELMVKDGDGNVQLSIDGSGFACYYGSDPDNLSEINIFAGMINGYSDGATNYHGSIDFTKTYYGSLHGIYFYSSYLDFDGRILVNSTETVENQTFSYVKDVDFTNQEVITGTIIVQNGFITYID